MKNLLALIVALFISIFGIYGQNEWRLGPSVGTSLSPIKFKDSPNALLKPGLSLGFNAGPVWEKNWQLNFGLSFQQRYTSFQNVEPSGALDLISGLLSGIVQGLDLEATESVYSETTYWTVDFPINMQYKFNSGFFLEAGGYFNLLMNASSNVETNSHIPLFEVFDPQDLGLGGIVNSFIPENGTTTTSNQSTNGLTGLGGGLSAGLGADLDNIRLSVFYQYGLTDIRSDNVQAGVKNQQALSISITYLFSGQFFRSGLRPKYNLELIK
ncbi:MAG: outer membrane beta-barrel protein [Vicingaceae bacterium]